MAVKSKPRSRTNNRSGTGTQKSKGLKPYLYRVSEPLCPVPDIYTDTEYFYRYNPALGTRTEPKAYVNVNGETLAEYIQKHASRDNETVRTIRTKRFKTEETMLKAFRSCLSSLFITIPSGIFVNYPVFISDELKSGNDGNFQKFIAWSKHEVYDGVIIDDPSLEDNELTEFATKRPHGKVIEEIPRVYDMYGGEFGTVQIKKKQLDDRMRNLRRTGRKYVVDYSGYILSEEDTKKLLGVSPPADMQIGQSNLVILDRGMEKETHATVYRTASKKPASARKNPRASKNNKSMKIDPKKVSSTRAGRPTYYLSDFPQSLQHRLRETANHLYDGGWRSKDYEDMLEEIANITPVEAAFICDILEEIEKHQKQKR